jgi:NTE family protein
MLGQGSRPATNRPAEAEGRGQTSVALFCRGWRLNLALQGGGAHGTFTWGVLDRLLEVERLEIACISGTSAGAINAVALADGYAEGGAAGARARLASVWGAMGKATLPESMRAIARASFTRIANMFSPYEFNPLGIDPLRALLEANVDFARLREKAPFELLIAATEVATGRTRLFRRHEITADAVLASCCLPMIHHAVKIGGRAYWDGGYSANPDLVTLAGSGHSDDTLVVLLDPISLEATPTRARDIGETIVRLTFNGPLLHEARMISEIKQLGWLARRGAPAHWKAIRRHRFHLIQAGPYTAKLPSESKLEPNTQVFAELHEAGRAEAGRWVESCLPSVGRRATTDLAKLLVGS